MAPRRRRPPSSAGAAAKAASTPATTMTVTSSSTSLSITNLILSHFDKFQRTGHPSRSNEEDGDEDLNGGGRTTSTAAALALLHDQADATTRRIWSDIESYVLNASMNAVSLRENNDDDDEEDGIEEETEEDRREELRDALIRCVDSALSSLVGVVGGSGVANEDAVLEDIDENENEENDDGNVDADAVEKTPAKKAKGGRKTSKTPSRKNKKRGGGQSKKDAEEVASKVESVRRILELAAALSCGGRGGGGRGRGGDKGAKKKNNKGGAARATTSAGGNFDANGTLARAVVTRASQWSDANAVDVDSVRIESCRFLGRCVDRLLEATTRQDTNVREKEEDATMKTWREECIDVARDALLKRLTDRSQSVRCQAVKSCGAFFARSAAIVAPPTTAEEDGMAENEKVEDSALTRYGDIGNELLIRAAHDPSPTVRAEALRSLPSPAASTSNVKGDVEEEDPMSSVVLPRILERVRDVKASVRTAAIDVLKEKWDVVADLTEDQRSDLIRMGLTDRCRTTHAATAKLLCSGWMKRVKFDPIALLRLLDPIGNESACEKAAKVVLAAASDDDEDSTGNNDNLGVSTSTTLKDLSGPEKRAYREGVLRRHIDAIASAAAVSKATTPVQDEEDHTENETEKEDDKQAEGAPLDPASVLYVRVRCDATVESKTLVASKKAEILGSILPDIPVLCQALRNHLDRLVESIRDEDGKGEDEDDDEAAAVGEAETFVCLQLLRLAGVADLKEEGSRRHFLSLVKTVLCSLETPDDLVEGCVKAMAVAHDTEAHFLQTVSEVLADVTEDSDENGGDVENGEDGMEEETPEATAAAAEVKVLRQLRAVAILSSVLERTSGRMASSPVLKNFASHILPAVTSTNALLRESGVSTLGRYALLSDEGTVLAKFKPLLMKIASGEAERIEVRAQAALALCDLALLFDGALTSAPSVAKDDAEEDEENGEETESSSSFQDLLDHMLNHSKAPVVVVAAEIAAKLLFAGKIHDAKLLARLLVIFFDENFSNPVGNVEEGDEVMEVGSPVRLQQLLSVFFPAYSMKTQDGNDALMESVKPMLAMVNERMASTSSSKSRGRGKKASWPIAKMVEYVCATVDLADKKKEDEKAPAGSAENDKAEAEEEMDEGEEASPAVPEESAEKEDDENFTEASSTLLASIAVAEYLAEESSFISTVYLRALCKILGGAVIDVEVEDASLLSCLKKNLDEAQLAVSDYDQPAARSLEKLARVLSEIEYDSGSEGDDDEDSRSNGSFAEDLALVEAMEKATMNETPPKTEALPKEVEEIVNRLSLDGSVPEDSDCDDDSDDDFFDTKENTATSSRASKGDRESTGSSSRSRRQLVDVNE